VRYAAAVAGITTLLAGCNGGGSSRNLTTGLIPNGLNTADPLAQGGLDLAAARASFRPHRLWISPDAAKGKPLLFVTAEATSGAVTVNVLSLPDLIIKGQAGGFMSAAGECADRNGQIWVVDLLARNVTRWSRSLQMTGELSDNYGYPWSCAVDPTTGNLAIANFSGTNGGPGSVAIYAHARGSGKPIMNPKQLLYQWLGYDTSGNLWVDGKSNAQNFILSSCSASSCRTIKITGGTIYDAGFVQWAAGLRSWYVADEECRGATCIYPVSARGALGAPIMLKDPTGQTVCNFALSQGVIANAKSLVLAAGFTDKICGGVNGLALWNFPAGGAPTHANDIANVQGAAISLK
jgi:hypothetical protein